MQHLWSSWKKIARKIGDFQGQLFFLIFYYLLVFPLGLLVSRSKDYLRLQKKPSWDQFVDNQTSLTQTRLQS